MRGGRGVAAAAGVWEAGDRRHRLVEAERKVALGLCGEVVEVEAVASEDLRAGKLLVGGSSLCRQS